MKYWNPIKIQFTINIIILLCFLFIHTNLKMRKMSKEIESLIFLPFCRLQDNGIENECEKIYHKKTTKIVK